MSSIPTHKSAASKDALPPPGSGLRYPTSGKTIYHRPLNRSRTSELSQSSFAYLFSEMVSYAQRRVTGIQDLEKRYVPPPQPPPAVCPPKPPKDKNTQLTQHPSASRCTGSTCKATR